MSAVALWHGKHQRFTLRERDCTVFTKRKRLSVISSLHQIDHTQHIITQPVQAEREVFACFIDKCQIDHRFPYGIEDIGSSAFVCLFTVNSDQSIGRIGRDISAVWQLERIFCLIPSQQQISVFVRKDRLSAVGISVGIV